MNLKTASLIVSILISNCSIAAEVRIESNLRFQTIEGWGASSNFYEEDLSRLPDSLRTGIFDLVYGDLGMNILCIRLYARFQTEEHGAYHWEVMAPQRMILTEALRRGNINYIWVKVSSPPGWMKDNNDDANGGHVLPQNYQNYANYLADYFIGMDTTYGFHLDGLSLFNEPGFEPEYESSGTTPEEYRDILKVVHATFEERGLGYVRFHGPESGHITGDGGALSRYLPVIMADSVARQALDVVQTHQYGDFRMLYGIGPADDWEGLRELADENHKPVWESEVFVGGEQLGSQDIWEGLRVSQFIWTAMTKGNVEAWHYWQYAHLEGANNSSGVVSYSNRQHSYTVRPRYYVMKQWVKYVPPGSVRIEATSDTDSLFAAAYTTSDSTVTIIAFNLLADTLETRFVLPWEIMPVKHVRTSDVENYVEQNQIEPTENQFTLPILPHSISTLQVTRDLLSVSRESLPTSLQLLTAYPNPFNSITRLNFTLERPGDVTIELTDLSGRSVTEIAMGILPEGDHSTIIDAADLAPGVYYVGIKDQSRSRISITLLK